MADKKQEARTVELGDKVKGLITSDAIDVKKYIGVKAKIEAVEEQEGEFGFMVKLTTGLLGKETVGTKEVEVRASRLISLQQNASGEIGWTEKSNMAKFLAKHKLAHYNDAKGMEVVIVDNDKGFLTFN